MIYIEAFWQVADGDNWSPAFLRAQQSVTQRGGQSTPFELRFHAPRVYTFHDYAEVISAVELKGERADAANLPRLYFPEGHGLRTHFLGSYQPDLQASSQLVIDGLWRQGNGAARASWHLCRHRLRHPQHQDHGFRWRWTTCRRDHQYPAARRRGRSGALGVVPRTAGRRNLLGHDRGATFRAVAEAPAVATDIITTLPEGVPTRWR